MFNGFGDNSVGHGFNVSNYTLTTLRNGAIIND